MNDTELLDWFEQNGISFIQNLDESYTMWWISSAGIRHKTNGVSLRDCIRGAFVDILVS